MRSEERSAISVVFVLLVAGTMTAVATVPDAGVGDESMAQAGNASADTPATTITVTATGKAQGEPDVAVIHLESAATADEPGAAADRLAANASQMREALQAANVSADQITTSFYDLSADEPRTPEADDSNETRYTARQGFAVRVENTSRVGELVDVAVNNGATGVNNVEFTVSDENRSDLRDRALDDAMTSARAQAETLAATEGLEITGVASISTGDDGPRPFVTQEAALQDAGTQIESGPVSVQTRVQVTYNATA